MSKKTKKYGFRNSKSKDGYLSIKINPDIAELLKSYCENHNDNCGGYVNRVVKEALEKESRKDLIESLRKMTKEEAIAQFKKLMSDEIDKGSKDLTKEEVIESILKNFSYREIVEDINGDQMDKSLY